MSVPLIDLAVVLAATVSGDWSGGASGSDGCTTGTDGTCSVSVGGIRKREKSATFTASDVTHISLTYDATANHDPDGDSDGTAIDVAKPCPARNESPTATIDSPADGASFDSGVSIAFSGSANDADVGEVTASLVWTSDRDDQIGTGGSFSATLTDGPHTIIATATDSDGATGDAQITISVGDTSSDDPISLSADGYKVTTEHHIDLTWGGASGDSVDLYVGDLSKPTENDGEYTHSTTNKGGGSYIFQVCENGSSTCPNKVTVTF